MRKIALDLDGVVFDSENLYRVYTEIYDTDNYKDSVIDNTERLFKKRYNWGEEESNKLYNEIFETVLKTANIMTGAEIVLNKLKEKYEFIIVTSRSDFEVELSKDRLSKIGLGNIPIFKNERHKIDRFIKEKVDYIIDDDTQICINAAENNICALYFKNNASNRIDKENLINVNNWGEIYKYLTLNLTN